MSDNQADQGYGTVNVYRAPGAVKIELNRPDRLNAWSKELSADLLKVLTEVAADDQVRAVMLTGAGRAFCSGADLKDGLSAARNDDGQRRHQVRPRHLVPPDRHPHPRDAQAGRVRGERPGGRAGLSLALAADLVVAAESASFSLAFVNIGLVPTPARRCSSRPGSASPGRPRWRCWATR